MTIKSKFALTTITAAFLSTTALSSFGEATYPHIEESFINLPHSIKEGFYTQSSGEDPNTEQVAELWDTVKKANVITSQQYEEKQYIQAKQKAEAAKELKELLKAPSLPALNIVELQQAEEDKKRYEDFIGAEDSSSHQSILKAMYARFKKETEPIADNALSLSLLARKHLDYTEEEFKNLFKNPHRYFFSKIEEVKFKEPALKQAVEFFIKMKQASSEASYSPPLLPEQNNIEDSSINLSLTPPIYKLAKAILKYYKFYQKNKETVDSVLNQPLAQEFLSLIHCYAYGESFQSARNLHPATIQDIAQETNGKSLVDALKPLAAYRDHQARLFKTLQTAKAVGVEINLSPSSPDLALPLLKVQTKETHKIFKAAKKELDKTTRLYTTNDLKAARAKAVKSFPNLEELPHTIGIPTQEVSESLKANNTILLSIQDSLKNIQEEQSSQKILIKTQELVDTNKKLEESLSRFRENQERLHHFVKKLEKWEKDASVVKNS